MFPPTFTVRLILLLATVTLPSCAHPRRSPEPGASRMTTLTLRLKPHEDLKGALERVVLDRKIDAACVLTCVASLERAALRYANQSEATVLEGKFEITSLVGTISRNGSHLHAQLADGQGRSMGGHVLEGCRIYTTAEVVLGILTDVSFWREPDPVTGYRELVIRPRAARVIAAGNQPMESK
ncbi:MAG: uncharacterized protein QOF48_989 [Verrucomicrobiota bacterium]|jgi:predicted DNA-binding protein with PD1-like motif